jgi:hypothetical protein
MGREARMRGSFEQRRAAAIERDIAAKRRAADAYESLPLAERRKRLQAQMLLASLMSTVSPLDVNRLRL